MGLKKPQYFNYIVAASFIGGVNGTTQRKPPTCLGSLTNLLHNVVLPERDSN